MLRFDLIRRQAACWLLMLSVSACGHAVAEDSDTVTVLHTYLMAPARAATLQATAHEAGIEVRFLLVDSVQTEDLRAALSRSRLVLVDLPHASVVPGMIATASAAIEHSKLPYVVIGDTQQVRSGDLPDVKPLQDHVQVPEAWAARIREYYRYGGQANTALLVAALADGSLDDVEATTELPAAKPFPEQGFYHPDWPDIQTSLDTVAGLLDGNLEGQRERETSVKSIVAIAINPVTISSGDTAWLDALIASLAKHGLHAYAFYGPRQNAERFAQMTRREIDGNSTRYADLIINASLVFRPQETKAELDLIGVPVLQTLPSLEFDAEQWRASDEGLPLGSLSYYYASSELAGMIDPMLISARNSKTSLLESIPEQTEAVAAKAKSICRLQQSERSERRIAMMVYNYPQGETNFGASFLNVPRSLANVLQAMKLGGYETEGLDESVITSEIQSCLRSVYDPARLVAQHAEGSAELLPLGVYQAWFDQLPAATQQRIEDYWGPPSASAVQIEDDFGFVIPCLQVGNVCIMPQPLRFEITSATETEVRVKRINHTSSVPLSHTYLATYLYLRDQWQAHAVVHFGTHGTLEWAPGKQRALSVDDDPSLALGSIPNFYPYIMDNLGEATTAKRRGRATMISHLTPMFSPAGFRPGLHEMHVLMHDWETVAPGPVRNQMENQLVEMFVEHHLDRDLEWSPEQIGGDFPAFMEVLHPYLDDIAQSAQPQGLAVLGDVPDPQRRFGMVMQMLRKRLIDALGEDIDEVFLIDAEQVTNSRPGRWLRLALQDPEAASRLDLRAIDRLDSSASTSVPNRAAEKTLDPAELLELAHEAQRLDTVLAQNNEIESLLAALDGQHVPSSYGGDPVRNPESLPTGRNLYGFDPSRVPTTQAWQIGVGVLDDWIESYRHKHDGEYPQQIAFTMWAGETMRHHGVMEAQIMHALGVRPRWNGSGRMTGFDIVPASQLGRPRLDVLMSVTGSYRDQFPHLMRWIDEAVVAVAALEASADETPSDSVNYVARHTERLRRTLEESGVAAADAVRQSTARVFSNESGGYGTGLNNAADASDVWESQTRGGGDTAMAELFTQRMGHAYGEGLGGVPAAKLFANQLANVDAAFMARSSNTYGVLTSDDPYAYLGGFSLAVRAAGRKPPELYVQNLRDESEVIVDSASGAIAKEMQTRYLHPQWIKAQQAEGYSGTLQVLKATKFLWGWQVAAPETVREDQWHSMMDVYVNDKYNLGTREWFQQDNHAALAQILERMIDAVRLGYWQPDAESRATLLEAYADATQASELIQRHQAVTQFVSAQREVATGAKPDAAANEVTANQPTQFVRGQELRPQRQSPDEIVDESPSMTWRTVNTIAVMMLLFVLGAFLQYRRVATG